VDGFSRHEAHIAEAQGLKGREWKMGSGVLEGNNKPPIHQLWGMGSAVSSASEYWVEPGRLKKVFIFCYTRQLLTVFESFFASL